MDKEAGKGTKRDCRMPVGGGKEVCVVSFMTNNASMRPNWPNLGGGIEPQKGELGKKKKKQCQ